MSRLIKRFTGDSVRKLGDDISSLDIMSDDFNNAEPYGFHLERTDYTSAMYYVEAKCSESTPGITLSIRDTNVSKTFDEQIVAQNIADGLVKNHLGGLWNVPYMSELRQQMIADFATAKSIEDGVIYKHASYNRGGVVRSGVIPITIFRGARMDNTLFLGDIVGLRQLSNIKDPSIEIYLDDNSMLKLTGVTMKYDDAVSELLGWNSIITVSTIKGVKKMPGVNIIPQDIINDEEAARAYLAQNQFVREDNNFSDIDLF